MKTIPRIYLRSPKGMKITRSERRDSADHFNGLKRKRRAAAVHADAPRALVVWLAASDSTTENPLVWRERQPSKERPDQREEAYGPEVIQKRRRQTAPSMWQLVVALGAQAIAGPSTFTLDGLVPPVASRSCPRTSHALHLSKQSHRRMPSTAKILPLQNLHHLYGLIPTNCSLHKCSSLGH